MLVLASTSAIRRELLARAGLQFEAVQPAVDETELKSRFGSLDPAGLAQSLAAAKAVSVSARHPDALVIGADQVLNHAGRSYDKPRSREEARRQLWSLRGSSHSLETAVCCVRAESLAWQHLGQARLTMRPFSEPFLDSYLAHMGDEVTTSVGGYKLEGYGVQLFEAIAGDYFTILGLPLLPLLDFLRRDGALAA